MSPESTPSVETQLAVINTKLDTLIATQNDHEPRLRAVEAAVDSPDEKAALTARIAALEIRATSLEKFRWLLVGAALAGSAGAGIGSTAAVRALGG